MKKRIDLLGYRNEGLGRKKTKVELIDLYACCDCPRNQKNNIKCFFGTVRDDPGADGKLPQPCIVDMCPRYHKPCHLTYFQTTRETVECL